MRINKFEKRRKRASLILLIIYGLNFIFTSHLYAGGGPTQPEFTGFKPIGVSQNVSHFTGDFSYSIPLMDVGGFPLALNYTGTSSNDEEATWTGLGWNLNIGTVNRQLRGIPDEFNGIDRVYKEQNLKDNLTVGLNLGANFQPFNFQFLKRKLKTGLTMGVFYNNYTGWGNEFGISPTFSLSNSANGSLTAGLSLKSSSESGMTITPSLSLSTNNDKKDEINRNFGLSIGAPINSREGLKQISFAANVSSKAKKDYEYGKADSKGDREKVKKGELNASSSLSSSISFASPSYNPKINMPMWNHMYGLAINGDVTLFGIDFGASAMGYMSLTSLREKYKDFPLYGYMNSELGKNDPYAIMDFNREKDIPYSPNVPTIAVPNLTYDMFMVNQPELTMQFRAHRTSSGILFDPYAENKTTSANLGGEIGAAWTFQAGGTFNGTWGGTETKKWMEKNQFLVNGDFVKSDKIVNPVAEDFIIKSNGEMTPTDMNLYSKYAENKPINVALEGNGNNSYASKDFRFKEPSKFMVKSSLSNISNGNIKNNTRITSFTYLTKAERNKFGFEKEIRNYKNINGTPIFEQNSFSIYNKTLTNIDHHISEITITNPDGRRCIYGIPAYNNFQKEVTFAVKNAEEGDGRLNKEGLIKYTSQDASINNKNGIDNYFNSEKMPAYPHSWLLTSIVSPDYYDLTGDGVSEDDLGTAFKFNYSLLNDAYSWRVPTAGEPSMANYNKGIYTDKEDDKATYIQGTREEWYIHSIESKTMVALFFLSERHDAIGEYEHNGKDFNSKKYKLDKISLYSKSDLLENKIQHATPIKTVHFVYSYRLCKGVKNHLNAGQGKLTLDEVYFTYGKSTRAALNKYKFDYGYNPDYAMKNNDRWGNYKNEKENLNNMRTSEFPYTLQDKSKADLFASAWQLNKIILPSGGVISVNYESDDYSYVQNKRVAQMVTILGVGTSPKSTIKKELYNEDIKLDYVFFSFPNNQKPKNKEEFKTMFLEDQNNLEMNNQLYFRMRQNLIPGEDKEYIPGYANIEDFGLRDANIGWIKIARKEEEQAFAYSGMQFLKTAIPAKAYPWSKVGTNTGPLSIIMSIAGFIGNLSEMFSSYPSMARGWNYSRYFDPEKSYIRLLKPDYTKYGGGTRVKKISISDEWANMVNEIGLNNYSSGLFGQEYDYTIELNGKKISSGVAEYEPLLGGDENPFRRPIHYEGPKSLFAPTSPYYVEEPICEGFFPSPSVGYSKVSVKSINSNPSNIFGTGFSEYEFYTAKDFPTKTDRTNLSGQNVKRFSPNFFSSFLKIDNRTGLYLSQGYVVETNDMHGKSKSEVTYNQKGISISKTENYYLTDKDKIISEVPTINENGTIENVTLGMNFDFYTDMRNQSTEIGQLDLELGGGFFIIPLPFPIAIPHFSPFPPFGIMEQKFYSSSSMKYINRKSIPYKVVKIQDGSEVVTENLLWDKNTGDVLITKLNNQFDEPIYSVNYPAYWKYKEMDFSYKNIGLEFKNQQITNGNIPSFMNNYVFPGDELGFTNGTINNKYWVIDNPSNSTKYIIDQTGNRVSIIGDFKIIRSGRRNLISNKMFSATMLKNPLNNFLNLNANNKILNASGIVYSDRWKIIKNSEIKKLVCKDPIAEKELLVNMSNQIFQHIKNKNIMYINQNAPIPFPNQPISNIIVSFPLEPCPIPPIPPPSEGGVSNNGGGATTSPALR